MKIDNKMYTKRTQRKYYTNAVLTSWTRLFVQSKLKHRMLSGVPSISECELNGAFVLCEGIFVLRRIALHISFYTFIWVRLHDSPINQTRKVFLAELQIILPSDLRHSIRFRNELVVQYSQLIGIGFENTTEANKIKTMNSRLLDKCSESMIIGGGGGITIRQQCT